MPEPGSPSGGHVIGMQPATARSWLVYLPALAVYVTAVTGRASFSVAVPQAGERLTGASSVLALFVVLQLAVYALAQVPVGLLLDRFGTRRVLVAGALIVAVGQVVLACAHSLPTAVLARVLVGAGDATAFISVVRLIPSWFPLGRVPLMTQVTSIMGQLGQVVCAFPFLALLVSQGWGFSFAVLGGAGMAMGMLALALVRDTPGGDLGRGGRARETVRETLGRVLREPGTWLGFFTHWTGMLPAAVLTLMWGLSWMTEGLGLPRVTASTILSLNTLAGILAGPVVGMLSARLPAHRSTLVLASGMVALAAWCVALGASSPLLAALSACVVTGATAPFASIGFDSARAANVPARWGTASGVVNMGGFTATIVAVELVGVVLDLSGGRTVGDFRLALLVLAPLWMIGMAGLLVTRHAVRARRANI